MTLTNDTLTAHLDDRDLGPAITAEQIDQLAALVHDLYTEHADQMVFHSWSHVQFVHDKAREFAGERGADVDLVRVCALVHDLNYLEDRSSGVEAGCALRADLLGRCGFDEITIKNVERVVVDASIANRGRTVEVEIACLSDADTLYKALPITPVLLSHRYLAETGLRLADLAAKIVDEQSDKIEDGYYFYDESLYARYGEWARVNIELWRTIRRSLDDPAVASLLAVLEGPITG